MDNKITMQGENYYLSTIWKYKEDSCIQHLIYIDTFNHFKGTKQLDFEDNNVKFFLVTEDEFVFMDIYEFNNLA